MNVWFALAAREWATILIVCLWWAALDARRSYRIVRFIGLWVAGGVTTGVLAAIWTIPA